MMRHYIYIPKKAGKVHVRYRKRCIVESCMKMFTPKHKARLYCDDCAAKANYMRIEP